MFPFLIHLCMQRYCKITENDVDDEDFVDEDYLQISKKEVLFFFSR